MVFNLLFANLLAPKGRAQKQKKHKIADWGQKRISTTQSATTGKDRRPHEQGFALGPPKGPHIGPISAKLEG